MTVEIDLSQLASIARLLDTAPKQAADEAHKAAQDVGRKVTSAAKAAAPRDRPWLATGGIRQKSWRDRNGNHTDIYTVPDPEGRPVGFFVEFGTADTAPQPFLEPQMAWAPEAFSKAITDRINPLEGA